MSIIVKKILWTVLRQKNRKTGHCCIALTISRCKTTNGSDFINVLILFFECLREEMARHYQIASVLYDVLKTVTPEKFHAEFDIYAKEVEKEKASFSHYNILPLNISGQRQPVMEIPEIKAAVDLLRKIDGLPMPRLDPVSAEKETDVPTVRDLFDWLWLTFGFQKGNVENQKEHLILLLANIDMRKGANAYQSDRHNHVYGSQMHSDTVRSLMRKIFENYISWCRYLHLESNIK
jgi:callose synthase